MKGKIIGLFYDPWRNTRESSTSFRNPVGLWKKAVRYRANPRSSGYMKALLAERCPEAEFFEIGPSLTDIPSRVSKIIFLYPDAIGLGFSPIERRVAQDAPNAPLEILSGRRRQFALDKKSRNQLRLRRFLEWTMLVEVLAGAVILVVTPFLILIDAVRTRT